MFFSLVFLPLLRLIVVSFLFPIPFRFIYLVSSYSLSASVSSSTLSSLSSPIFFFFTSFFLLYFLFIISFVYSRFLFMFSSPLWCTFLLIFYSYYTPPSSAFPYSSSCSSFHFLHRLLFYLFFFFFFSFSKLTGEMLTAPDADTSRKIPCRLVFPRDLRQMKGLANPKSEMVNGETSEEKRDGESTQRTKGGRET